VNLFGWKKTGAALDAPVASAIKTSYVPLSALLKYFEKNLGY